MKLKSGLIKAAYIFIAFILTFVPYYTAVAVSLISGSTNVIVVTAITDALVIAVFTGLYVLFRYKKKDNAFKIHSEFSVKHLFMFVFLSAFLSLTLNTIFYWFSVHVSSAGMEARSESYQSVSFVVLLIFNVIIAPVSEEIMYRMFMYNFLKRKFHWLAAMIVSSLFFGMIHMTGPHLVIGSVFGMFMCLCYELSGSCFVSILMHIIYNLLALFIPSSKLGNSTALTMLFIGCVIVVFSMQMFSADSYINGTHVVRKKQKKKKAKELR